MKQRTHLEAGIRPIDLSGSGYRAFLKSYLFLVGALLVFIGYVLALHRDGFAIGDWLINYSGGFVRRGLLGNCLLLITHLFNTNEILTLLLLQIACYALIFRLIWVMLRQLSWPLWMILVVYSPATLSLTLLNPQAAYKKEILLFVLMLGVALLPSDFRLRGITGWLLIPGCVLALLLTHEGLAAFLPYLFAIYLIRSGTVRSGFINFIPTALAAAAACVLATRHQGSLAGASQICSSIGGTDLSAPICAGGIRYLVHDLHYARAEIPEWIHYWHLVYVAPYLIVLAVIPLLMGLAQLWRLQRYQCSCLALCTLAAWLSSILLFLYARDWYRWIYIHSFCAMVVLLMIERHRQRSLAVKEASWSLPKRSPQRYAVIAFVAFMTIGWQCAFTHHFPMPLDSVSVFYVREVKFFMRNPSILRTPPQSSSVEHK